MTVLETVDNIVKLTANDKYCDAVCT